ncbi:MAG: tetratricopeptide repeat protein [Terriglobales bacterium]
MANENVTTGTSSSEWQAKQVYALAVVCLLIGLAVGYLFRGSRSPAPPVNAMQSSAAPGAPTGMGGEGGMGNQPVSLDQMKHMADKQAEPLLAKLKDDPKNADLLIQTGKIYLSTHQFKEAANYFGKSLEVKPKNVPIRTLMASCLYYNGDVDGALHQLGQATTDDPKDANSLFNLGMIRWQGKKDAKGALAAWGQLLRNNPQLEPSKRAQVEKLMADVRQSNATN